MKYAVPVILVVATAFLMVLGLYVTGQAGSNLGVAKGSALYSSASTPEQALDNFLIDVQRRNWDRALANIASSSPVDKQSFIQDWLGSNGSLRSFSSLESFESRPLHATNDEAQMRVRLHFSTPIGPIEDVRDFHLIREGGAWKALWPKVEVPSVPAQVVPVTYLRWDLVTGGAEDQWGSKNVDAPHVRIISMNAVDSAEGATVMGEVTNEDTVPAFVTVNSTLVDGAGNPIDEESSFDKIAHILLPKQVSPYRIDFPGLRLKDVKNVRMDVKATLVPASADPVIGVMNQRIESDSQGKSVLHGDLLNQSGQTVNIPHVIASFYDNNGKVVWVSDGYVDQALLPQSSEPFAVEIPKSLSASVHGFHVVVNQYSLGKS
ncbi:MAG TPA: hypothetical protein VK722_05475 [Candidatus Aquilonibacter sp.]|jgi:hypothetical protein|nr:hypothetical protein [Candidatus Aquilonibacter sp.]